MEQGNPDKDSVIVIRINPDKKVDIKLYNIFRPGLSIAYLDKILSSVLIEYRRVRGEKLKLHRRAEEAK